MKKQKIIIGLMVAILIVLMILVSMNFKSCKTESANNEYNTDVITPIVTQIPTRAPEYTDAYTIDVITTEYIYKSIINPGELCIMGVEIGMRIAEVEVILGSPINEKEETYAAISGSLVTYEYEFGGVKFHKYNIDNVETTSVIAVYITVSGYKTPWGIEIGDGVYEVFEKIDIPLTSVENKESKIYMDEYVIGSIEYTHYTREEVMMIEIYNGESSGSNSFYVTFIEGEASYIGITAPHLN